MGILRDSHLARSAALFDGDVTYQGAPCVHQHSGLRYASNRACVQCTQATTRAYGEANAGKERERKRAYATARREALKKKGKGKRG